jgi:hypothetical protein
MHGFVPLVRNRAAFDPGLVRFRFVFGSLWSVRPQRLGKSVRFWFDFVPFLVRFWFEVLTAEDGEFSRNNPETKTAGRNVDSPQRHRDTEAGYGSSGRYDSTFHSAGCRLCRSFKEKTGLHDFQDLRFRLDLVLNAKTAKGAKVDAKGTDSSPRPLHSQNVKEPLRHGASARRAYATRPSSFFCGEVQRV